jgi:hypothetical protein
VSRLFVIEDRDRDGVGLARVGLSRLEADRVRDGLAIAYPAKRFTVKPQLTARRRVVYPVSSG